MFVDVATRPCPVHEKWNILTLSSEPLPYAFRTNRRLMRGGRLAFVGGSAIFPSVSFHGWIWLVTTIDDQLRFSTLRKRWDVSCVGGDSM